MENEYKDMSVTELEKCLKSTQEKFEDAEDELSLILERSNSGQHMSSKYVQSNKTRIEQEIEFLNNKIIKIKIEIENRE
jgi:hypothetical protein